MSSQYYIITVIKASFMHVSYSLVFHQSKCISAMRLIFSTVATYIRSNLFIYLCVLCYGDACLKSSALRVGMKTLHNALYQGLPTRRWRQTVRSPSLIWSIGPDFALDWQNTWKEHFSINISESTSKWKTLNLWPFVFVTLLPTGRSQVIKKVLVEPSRRQVDHPFTIQFRRNVKLAGVIRNPFDIASKWQNSLTGEMSRYRCYTNSLSTSFDVMTLCT